MNQSQTLEAIGAALRLEDASASARLQADLTNHHVSFDLQTHFATQLQSALADHPDRDRIFVNIHRFLEASRSPQGWLSLFEREPDAFQILVRLFSTSQYLSDILIADPEVFDLVRLTDGQPIHQDVLQDEVLSEVGRAHDLKSVMRILRDFRHRESLRIAYGDFIHNQPVDNVTEQLSILADCLINAAVRGAQALLESRATAPTHPDGEPLQFCVLALGKLGGRELNYASDVDLVLIHETRRLAPAWEKPNQTVPHEEYFERLGRQIIKILSDSTPQGMVYRVDMRLRPHGRNGPLVISVEDAVRYYDSAGRTWERQAFVKARPVAGDLVLGQALIDELQPWIYRRYLMRADITGIAALKRRIEQHAVDAGEEDRNVKLGKGGIRDIEYVIQFLQLLHGAESPNVRCTGTLEAIQRLQLEGCLTAEEQSILEENYRYLRRIEHHLQIMFDRQTHTLPEDDAELERFARRLHSDEVQDPEQVMRSKLESCKLRNRQILNHLLHDAFADYQYDGSELACQESDLILDPEPSSEKIQSTLAPYGFADCSSAYRRLQDLASESIRFLSTRRSRHFLAAIAPRLLEAISQTPNPDATLISLTNVSASLGGKAVLWELFSVNPPSMELCVRLCACSPYLASILTGNPGMIDELLDSLMLPALPSHEELAEGLHELCRGAVEIAPMLHSFKNSMHLRVGVRDILGKSTIVETHSALSDIAESCMEQVIHNEFHKLIHQMGVPVYFAEDQSEQAAELVVIAVGKLGGREPNYHSDLDVIFLFDGEGSTKSLVPNRRFEPTTNRHFFNQLCQRVIRAVTQIGTSGSLYDLDVRLRPLGRSGQLAITIDDLQRYFRDGTGQIWERQALCKARPIWGSPEARTHAMQCILSVLNETAWSTELTEQVYDHRMQLQHDAAPGNLKRGVGGTMDVEFVVQLLQLAHVESNPGVLVPGTLEALSRLEAANVLDGDTARELRENYEFLRSIESGIRLMNLSARHELPSQPDELEQLAFLLKSENRFSLTGAELAERCARAQRTCRAVFEATFAQWMPPDDPEDPA